MLVGAGAAPYKSGMSEDHRRRAPAASRNRDPILQVLQKTLPSQGTILEIASGTGEHACFFAAAFPNVSWQPTDMDDRALRSIEAYRQHEAPANVAAPMRLDVTADIWPIQEADGAVCINMVHISPWKCSVALLEGCAKTLNPGAPLVLYGPYKRGGIHTAPSNESFDNSLRQQNPEWGIRDLDEIAAVAGDCGLTLENPIDMPSNNYCVIIRQKGSPALP